MAKKLNQPTVSAPSKPAPDLSSIDVEGMKQFESKSTEKVEKDKLGGFDFSMLAEDEDDHSIDVLMGKKLDKKRFVVAKLVSYPNTKLKSCDPVLNGVRARFPIGEPRLVRFYFIKHARHSGFVGHSDGAENRVMLKNAPVFEIQEIPESFDNMSLESVIEFQEALYSKSGRQLAFASDEDA